MYTLPVLPVVRTGETGSNQKVTTSLPDQESTHAPKDKPGTTTASFSAYLLLSAVSRVDSMVPDNSSHGPLPAVGEMGAGSSAVPYASVNVTRPTKSSSSLLPCANCLPKASNERFSREAIGASRST